MRRALVAIAALVGVATVTWTEEVAPADARSPQAIPVDIGVPMAPVPVAAEGQWHMVYELQLTNFGQAELTLERLDVLDESGMTLASMSGEALDGVITRPGAAAGGNRRSLLGGHRSVVFLDVTTSAVAAPPGALTHLLTFRPLMTVDGTEQSSIEPAPLLVPRQAVPVFGPPLQGGCWIASHGLANNSSHRRTLIAIEGRARIAQRFAIDWIRVGADGQAFRGDPSDNRNWTPYGANVLAVADGLVVETLDGIAENDPTSDHKAVPITLTTVGGNHILLDDGHGHFIFYAHLQPGSLLVRRGERVRRGQVIARLGNSGQSDAPHLHIHVVDMASPLAAEGLPLVFDSFLLQGHLPSLRVLTDGTGWHPSAPPQRRRREMPLENAVVSFQGGASDCG